MEVAGTIRAGRTATVARVPVEYLPDEDGIRDRAGGTVVRTTDNDELLRCAKERALVLTRKEGALLRAELFGPAEISVLAQGAVGLMLQDIMRGEIKPKDGKQAIDIARIALQVYDKVTAGPGSPNGSADDTPQDRAAKIAASMQLHAALKDRARANVDTEHRADGRAPVDLDDFDFDDDDAIPARSAVRSLPSPPMTTLRGAR